MLTTITTISVALITAVLGPAILEWVKLKVEKSKYKKSTLEEAFDHNEFIDDQLTHILNGIHCDKIWIAQFHNGGHFYPTGKSIQKFSIFYEKITPTITPTQTIFQNIPVSFFPKAFSKLHSEGELYVNIGSTDEDFGLKIITGSNETSSLHLFGLNNINGEFIGILALEFKNHKPHFSKEEYIFIRQKIGAIGLLLSDYLKTNKK